MVFDYIIMRCINDRIRWDIYDIIIDGIWYITMECINGRIRWDIYDIIIDGIWYIYNYEMY